LMVFYRHVDNDELQTFVTNAVFVSQLGWLKQKERSVSWRDCCTRLLRTQPRSFNYPDPPLSLKLSAIYLPPKDIFVSGFLRVVREYVKSPWIRDTILEVYRLSTL